MILTYIALNLSERKSKKRERIFIIGFIRSTVRAMIKLYCFFILLWMIPRMIFSQQVEREMVVMEIVTGNWCAHCPGAAQGADDMVAAGHDVAAILNHIGDAFTNQYSVARTTYYNPLGFPCAYFDGIETQLGGQMCPNPPSMYDAYLTKYNSRKEVPSSFTIDMQGYGICNHFNMTLSVQKVAEAPTDNCAVHLVLTETNISCNWLCMTECNFTNRLMVPDPSGTPLNLTDNQQDIYLCFDLDNSWDADQCELIAFIQNNTTKEIYQAIKGPLGGYVLAEECDSVHVSPGWSGLSSHVEPLIDSVEDLFNPIVDDMVILLENGNMYWPGEDINTIVTWDPMHGYIIKMDDEATLVFVGNPVDNSTIQLAAGWNVIPVLSGVPVATTELFDPIGTNLNVVKEIGGGGIYWPGMDINTLPSLLPNKAYQVNVYLPCTIHYP